MKNINNILIADDMNVNRKLMKSILKSTVDNIRFFDAANGNEALDCIKNNDIDLVILDLMMPEKDGFEVLQELRYLPKHSGIPVIVNSVITEMEAIEETLKLGAIDYFTKPLTTEQMKIMLPLKVKNALERQEQKKLLVNMNKQMQQELDVANAFQKTLMAEESQLDAAHIYGKYMPCSQLGGDLYDCIQKDNELWFIIADVTGHGVAAAMAASMIKVMFYQSIKEFNKPNEVLQHINLIFNNIMNDCGPIIFSAFIGVIKNNVLTFSNAGHPYPILFKSQQSSVIMLEQNGFLIGAFKDNQYENQHIKLQKDDIILTYTDGLFGNDSNGNLGSWEDIYEFSVQNKGAINGNPKVFIDELIKVFKKFNGGIFNDDVAVMLIKSL